MLCTCLPMRGVMKERNVYFEVQIVDEIGEVILAAQQIDLLPAVWLHSSVDTALHRHRRGHGFESRWSHQKFSGQCLQLETIA